MYKTKLLIVHEKRKLNGILHYNKTEDEIDKN